MERSRESELMDLPGMPPALLEEDLENLRTINRCLGAYRGVIRSLARLVPGKGLSRFTLLDVGTGGADLPVAIARWARRSGVETRIVALDRDPVTIGVARRACRNFPEIAILRGDAAAPPFPDRAFDFVIASQLLHHFSEPEIVRALGVWSRIARRGLLVSDLIRHPLAYYAIFVLTRLFTRNAMTRVDAPLSVRRAFTLEEWSDLFGRAAAGGFELRALFPFRVLSVFSAGG